MRMTLSPALLLASLQGFAADGAEMAGKNHII